MEHVQQLSTSSLMMKLQFVKDHSIEQMVHNVMEMQNPGLEYNTVNI